LAPARDIHFHFRLTVVSFGSLSNARPGLSK
jgi:hypothetical protein